jgi:hypothetical protein
MSKSLADQNPGPCDPKFATQFALAALRVACEPVSSQTTKLHEETPYSPPKPRNHFSKAYTKPEWLIILK